MRPNLLLFKKEFQQNIILYVLPMPFVLTWLFFRLVSGSTVPDWATTVFGLALPFTLAVAYGLQSFDVEEDAQTRDFLLVKPLSIIRIVGEKFGIGLGILLLWTTLLLWGTSRSFYWPSIFVIESWIPLMVILGTVVAYSASFFTGLWISGPKKLLVASLASSVGVVWGALAFFSLSTFFLLNATLARLPFIQEILFYLSGVIVVGVFAGLQISLSVWILMQRPRLEEIPRLAPMILSFILTLFIALVMNYSINPPLRPARYIGSEIFGLTPSFWTIDGVWQPHGHTLLLAGTDNRLALMHPGKFPTVIYKGKKTPDQPIKDISWSPNGKMIAFSNKGQIFYMNINDKKPVWIGKGSMPSWSMTSNSIMFCQENSPPRSEKSSNRKITFHKLDFFKADLNKNQVEHLFDLQAFNTIWAWDSTRDILMFLDPYGRLTFYHKDKTDFIPVPSFDPSREGIFWSRFYLVPGSTDRYILVAFSFRFTDQDQHRYVARFYDFNIKTMKIGSIVEVQRGGSSNLIFNPSDGTCLWGQGSTYVKTFIKLPKEVKP